MTLQGVLLYLVAPLVLAILGAAIYDWLKVTIPALADRELKSRLKETKDIEISEYRWQLVGRIGSRFTYGFHSFLLWVVFTGYTVWLEAKGIEFVRVTAIASLVFLSLTLVAVIEAHEFYRRIQYAKKYYNLHSQTPTDDEGATSGKGETN